MAEVLVFIFSVALYVILIWSFFNPRESLLFGRRWMYKEEPEITEGAILYTRIASIAGLVLLTLFVLISILS